MLQLKRLAASLVVLPLACALPAAAAPSAVSDDGTGDLVVNGEVIPAAAVRREMVYRLGMRQLEARKLEILIQREIERRGLDAATLLEEGEVEGVIQSGQKRMKDEYGGVLTEEEILSNQGIDMEGWRDQTRLALLFNRLFLPENPAEWPEVTKRALSEQLPEEQREMFLEKMQEGYDKREAEGIETDPNDPQRLMFNMMLRGPIQLELEEEAGIKTAQDGLPPEVCMVVGDVRIRTDEVFESLGKDIAAIEWERTRRWLAKNAAVRQALQAEGAWLDDAAFQKVWEELEAKYENSFIPLEQIALAFKRFPSISAYRTYLRGLESFRNLVGDDLNDETLTAHLDRTNRLMGLEQVDAEVILLSAYDFRLSRWKENGWEDAKRRAIEVAQKLAAGEAWNDLLEEYSDYWDPPIPVSQQGQPQQQARRNGGKFGLKNRNSLLPMVDESDYLVFLNGTSVGDTIFFDLEEGKIGGPYKGSFGYYIARVKGRTPANKTFGLEDPSHRESIEQDYLQVRFVKFAREQMARADIKGL